MMQSEQVDGLKVLLVEDTTSLRALVSTYLRSNGLIVTEATSSAQAREVVSRSRPQVALLDIMLEDGESYELIAEMAKSGIPTMVVSSKDKPVDRIMCLEIGADDFLMKPFEMRELLLRIRRLSKLAKQDGPRSLPTKLAIGSVTVDLVTRDVHRPDGTSAKLTNAEFELLRLLLDSPGQILARSTIDQVVFKREGDEQNEGRNVDVLVSRLRRKIDPGDGREVIASVRQSGYVFITESSGTG